MASHMHPGSACTGVGHPCNPYFAGGPCGDTTSDCTNGGVLLGCSGGGMGNFLCEHEYYVVAPVKLVPRAARKRKPRETVRPARKGSKRKASARKGKKTSSKRTVSRRKGVKKKK